jgi:hypothetical protein
LPGFKKNENRAALSILKISQKHQTVYLEVYFENEITAQLPVIFGDKICHFFHRKSSESLREI